LPKIILFPTKFFRIPNGRRQKRKQQHPRHFASKENIWVTSEKMILKQKEEMLHKDETKMTKARSRRHFQVHDFSSEADESEGLISVKMFLASLQG
jgi:hypothetical protein